MLTPAQKGRFFRLRWAGCPWALPCWAGWRCATIPARPARPGFWVNLGISGSFFAFGGLWAAPFLHDVYGMARNVAAAHTSMLLLGFAAGAHPAVAAHFLSD